ncbi:FAD binding domain-containing protein [Nisaea denitrificans]|uniref:FAD binding domain-containing protein n=1 Tax=Nisaea denitrificans TaxID=390877 RepID=UPI000412A9B5|nr:xanthine dehydrogenase family protein subunit M [Nisaea denitrificans]
MIPGSFEYHRPESVDGAIALLNEHGDEARLLAGGHSLIPMMKLRMAVPSHIVDLQAIDSLHGISEEGGELVIGALTTQHEVLTSDLLAAKCPIIPEAAALIADPQVRYCGTIGGNVANGDPGNDMPAIMQALGARFRAVGPNGSRDIAARDYYEAAYFTELEENEVLTQIRIPTPAVGHGSAYEKQKRKIGDYATAAAAVILTVESGRCISASIALTNVASTPLYAEAAAGALVGTDLGADAVDTAVRLAEEITEPTSDGRGPADFRTHVAGIMVRRAIARAQKNAG